MSVETIDIDYVAKLARIELTEEEKALFSDQLGQVLEHFEQLKAVNVDGVEPMAHAVPVVNVWAEDTPGSVFSPEEALLNASEVENNQLVLPKIVGENGSQNPR